MEAAETFPVGDFIADELSCRGWSYAMLAERTGLSVADIDGLIRGTKPFLSRHAEQIGRAFGTSGQFWMNLNHTHVQRMRKETR